MGFELEHNDIKSEMNAEQIQEDSLEWWEAKSQDEQDEISQRHILEDYCKEKNIKVV